MKIEKVGVIGAGTMGNGIVQVCATSGLEVQMVDISEQALKQAENTISANLERMVKKEKITDENRHATLTRIKASTQLSDLSEVDLVIEAASESESVKLEIIREASGIIRREAIFASNTSSLSITKLAAASNNPDRFIGLHFFNPVPVMQLVEVISGLQTSEDTQKEAKDFISHIGKKAIRVKNSAGFAVNRILVPMINEAVFTLQEGIASAEEIDEGMKLGCNHVIGPLALADLIGLDTLLAVMDVFFDSFKDSKYRPAPLLREMVEAGYLGRKTGQGFFKY